MPMKVSGGGRRTTVRVGANHPQSLLSQDECHVRAIRLATEIEVSVANVASVFVAPIPVVCVVPVSDTPTATRLSN